MNNTLKALLESGDIISKRSLKFVIDDEIVAYTAEYHMNGVLGPFKWYTTWKSETCNEYLKLINAGIYIHPARARLYFPAYLDSRIPPENNEDIENILRRHNVHKYDKFDLIIAGRAWTPVHAGTVEEISPIDCPMDEIHAIEEIWAEYKRTL